VHEAAHAVVAVFLGMKARARLERGRPGCGACEIDAPEGADGAQRLLTALAAGSEGEGRLLHRPRTWHPSTEDAKAIARLLGSLDRPGAAARLAAAKRNAAKIVRDRHAWKAVEIVAAELSRRHSVDDAQVRDALAAAGLAPTARAVRRPFTRL
jgi:hypothetical protein